MEFTNNASGILGLAPNNSILKEASFIYNLKKDNKIDHLMFAINMGNGLGGSNIKFGSWDLGALIESNKNLTSI